MPLLVLVYGTCFGWSGTEHVEAAGPGIFLDMDVKDGSGPCNPVGATVNVAVGEEFRVAVCLADASNPPAAFNFDLLYDTSLFQSPNVECTDTLCLDANPDANAGSTTWGESLGIGWDCNIMEVDPPFGDKGGKAYMTCVSLQGGTLPTGAGVSSPLALVTFKVMGAGTAAFSLQSVAVFAPDAAKILECYEDTSSCIGGVATTEEAGMSVPTKESEASPTPGVGVTAGATPGAAAAAGTPASGPAATAAAATAIASGTKAADGVEVTPGQKGAESAAEGAEEGSSAFGAGAIAAVVVAGVIVVGGGASFVAWRRFRRS